MPLWLAPPKTSVIVINFMLNLHQSYQSPMSNAGAKLEKFVVKNLEGFQLILDPTGTRVGCHTGSNILVDLDISPLKYRPGNWSHDLILTARKAKRCDGASEGGVPLVAAQGSLKSWSITGDLRHPDVPTAWKASRLHLQLEVGRLSPAFLLLPPVKVDIDVRKVSQQRWPLPLPGDTSTKLRHRHLRHLARSNTYSQLVVWVTLAVAHWLCLKVNEVESHLANLRQQVHPVTT